MTSEELFEHRVTQALELGVTHAEFADGMKFDLHPAASAKALVKKLDPEKAKIKTAQEQQQEEEELIFAAVQQPMGAPRNDI